MKTAALLQQIIRLPFEDRIFIAEQILHSLRTEDTESVYKLKDWEQKELIKRLQDVENGDVVSDEDAQKILEQCFA